MKKDPLDRFLEKVQVGPLPVEWTGKPEDRTECLLWTDYKVEKDYGRFSLKGKPVRAHRWIYKECIGSIPKGLQLDHLCRVRSCVNPLHLEPVSNKENCSRSILHKQTTRINGLKKRKNNLPEGVTLTANKKRFKAQSRSKYIGTYDTPEEAYDAYQKFLQKGKREESYIPWNGSKLHYIKPKAIN